MTTSRLMPSRSMLPPRLTDRSAPAKRLPIWERAPATSVAVTQWVRGVAVDGQLERSREADADGAAVGDLLVEAGRDDVAVVDLDALGLEHVADGAAHGGHLTLLPVQGDGHVVAHGAVAEGGAGHGEDRGGREAEEGGLAVDQPCKGAARLHDSPNVVLPGPREPAHPDARRTTVVGVCERGFSRVRSCGAHPGADPKSVPIPANNHETITGVRGHAKPSVHDTVPGLTSCSDTAPRTACRSRPSRTPPTRGRRRPPRCWRRAPGTGSPGRRRGPPPWPGR